MNDFKNIIKNYSEKYMKQTFFCFVFIQILLFLLVCIFKQSPIFTQSIVFIIFSIFYLLSKDFIKDEKQKMIYLYIFLSMILLQLCSFSTYFIVNISKGFNSIAKQKSFFGISYLLDFLVIIGSFLGIKTQKGEVFIQAIYNYSFWKMKNCDNNDEEVHPGDIVLCTNKDTGKKVIMPLKDRFLHMLILGPTGSGKTSQTIIPMINQDMQNLGCGITVIEPKGDLAEKIDAMARYYGRKVMYFNPVFPDCPYFNPLFGEEDSVIENMATTFKMLSPDSPQFFKDMNEQLIRNSLKVLKRLKGNDATFIDMARLIQNSGGAGKKMVMQFAKMNAPTEDIAKENQDLANWFLGDYFAEKSKTYENCSGVRSQVSKLISNKYLRRVLNPPEGKNDIDFDKHLAEGGVITITTAQGTLRDLGKFLGYFIILQLQSAVFRRPGNEDTRVPHFLYIDEFQTYSNPGFADMLTQGRSYRVASQLATQNRALMAMGGGSDGKNFVDLVSTNARNLVIYPGGNNEDAKYYSQQFGEIIEMTERKGISRQKGSLFNIDLSGKYNESISYTEETKARFSPSDIIYRQFGEITYCLIQNNTLQAPGVGKIEYIDYNLNKELDRMVEEYKQERLSDEEKAMVDSSKNKKVEVESIDLSTTQEVPDIMPSIQFTDENDTEDSSNDKDNDNDDEPEYMSGEISIENEDINVESELNIQSSSSITIETENNDDDYNDYDDEI